MNALREAIRRDGRTAYRLAADSGVDKGALSRFLAGKRDMTLATADRLCRVLGLVLRPVERGRKPRRGPAKKGG